MAKKRSVEFSTQVWEEWVACACPCAACRARNGRRYAKGKGPLPVTDTHDGCACRRVTVPSRLRPETVARRMGFRAPVYAGWASEKYE